MMKEAETFGLRYGVVFSRKEDGKRSFLTVSCDDREFTDSEIAMISEKFSVWAETVTNRRELTDGELDVLRCLKDGLGQSAVSEQLRISESTVKQRAQKACVKLGAQNRTQAVAIAVARNYFDV